MRKLKLLLASVALLFGGGISVYADDVFKEVTGKITNPSFESENKTISDQQTIDPLTTGWKYSQSNGRAAIYNSESTTNMTYGASSASEGSYFLRIRSAGSDNATGTSTVTQKSAFSLDKGTYRITFDYKAAQPGSTDRTFTVYAKNGSTELGKKENAIPKSVSANTNYFSTGGGKDWTTDNLSFTLTSTTSVTLEIQCQTKKYSSGHTTLLLDNFILERNLTQSLKDLLLEANTFYSTEGSSYTALKAVIDATDTNETDPDELEDQYTALENALNLAKNHRKPWLGAKTTAQAAIDNTTDYGNVTGEEKTNLQSAIAADEPSDADGYDSAKSDLETKTSTFTGAKASYDAFITAKNAETPDLAYATSAKKAAVTTAKGASAATSASDADEKTAAIATALRAYYESHAAAENVATASDQTSRITDAEDPSNISAWTLNNTSGNSKMRKNSGESYTDADGTNNHTYFDSESWGTAFSATFTQDVTLPAGNYLLTVKARGNGTTTYKLIADDDETNITSIGSTGGVFGRGWNDYSVEFSIDPGKSVTLGIEVETGSSSNWISFGDFRLIKLDATYADDDDYAALAAAISTIEGSLGFDAGEYAPYNVASALATAKAFNPAEDNIQSEVQDATAALLALTTNISEVNAVNNGNFSEDFANSGWKVSNWGQQQTGLSGTYSTAYRNNPGNIQYGTKDYYKMPLKANTYYTLHVAYRKADNPSYGDRVTASVKNGDDGLASTNWGWTSSTSDWTEGTETFKTGSAGNYILKLQNSYNTCITGVTLFRATVAEVKTILNTELTAANTLYNSGANVGSGVFQIPTASGTAFSSAIETAQGVYDNGSATVDEVADAIADLQTAKTTYANATLNAPDSEKRYHLTIVRDEKAWDGNAITFMEGAANPTQGNYGIKYLTPANNNMCQAVKFTNTTGNKYKVSFLTRAGVEQYITTSNLGYSAGTDNTNKERIRTVDDASKALEIEIKATTTANQFRLYNTDRGAVIADNNNNDVYTNNSANFTISEASQVSVAINIADNVKLATRIFPFTPVLPSGVKAYSCGDSEGNVLTLVEVVEPAANTPYILYAESGYEGAALTGYGTATTDTYSTGWLTGVYTSTDAPVGSYVLQNNGGVSFYKVAESKQPSVGAYRCYLTAPTTARALYFDFSGETTGVDTIKALTSGKTTIYNAAGAVVPSLQKGLNIIKKSDGSIRKVMVK